MKRTFPIAVAALVFAGSAFADNCTIDLDGNDQMKFDKSEVTVSASCPEITINLTHSGQLPVNAMGHNVVITETGDYMPVAQDGVKAGLDNDYVPVDDSRVIAHTDMIGGGETTTVTFPGDKLSAGGDYSFFCSFPGHWTMMVGKVIVE